jgi:sulfonate transport system permease protein
MSEAALVDSVPSGPRRRPRKLLLGLLLPVALLAIWELSGWLELVDPRLLPPPGQLGETFRQELASGRLVEDLAASLRRDLIGFSIGSALGIAFGAAIGLSRLADRILGPWFNGLKQIALLAWIPLISIWFGFGETAKIVFITLAAFIPVALNTLEGVRSTSRQLIEVAETLKFSRWNFGRRLYLPSALPSIFTGIHLALIYSWLATIGAEYFMAVGPGIGGLIIAGRERFEMDKVMLGIVILGMVGYVINRLASVLEKYLFRWRDT